TFSFHHGWRHGDGLHGRTSLLVAENHRAALSGKLGPNFCTHHLRRLYPDVPAAICARLSWYAAPLPCLSARVSSAECDVDCWRVDFGCRVRAAADLFIVVASLRKNRRPKSMACNWSGMANIFAAAARQFS